MSDLVFLDKKKIFTTSKQIADGCQLQHHTITKVLRNFTEDFEQFGDLRFMELRSINSNGGRPEKNYLLNEDQATLLMMYLKNTYIVRKFKIKLNKEFSRLKKMLNAILIRQGNEQWRSLRESGKAIRKSETDMIKKFVEYATKQGSKSAKMYYTNITKMENKALFILNQKYPNIRNLLDEKQLSTLKVADLIVEKALEDGMSENLHYKDIYKKAKQRIEIYVDQSLGGKTIVPNLLKELK